MTSKIERIYACLPVWLQNVMVSFQGWVYNRKRYSKNYTSYVNKLMRSQWLSHERLKEIQTQELQSLVREAIEYVPYYNKLFKKVSIPVKQITPDNLSVIPLLEQSLLRTQTENFINKNRLKYGYDEGHTSGTSGIPLVFPYDLDSLRRNLAFRERQYRWAGLTGKERSARFSGRILLGRHCGTPYWRYNKPEKQWLFSGYHINQQTWPVYFKALQELDIAFIDGYPSSIFNLAKWIQQAGKSGTWRPWAIFLTGEAVMDYQKIVIEETFQCKVYNFYSSSEGAPFITECPAGSLHINPESGIIEFLREDGSYADIGEEGEMVVTSFFQKTLPLIRYRIGDSGALAEDQNCRCGRHFPVVKYISGREDDVLYSTERGQVGSAGLSTALYKIPRRLTESQIEQIGKDSFIFRYVPQGPPLKEQEQHTILDELYKRLGNSVKIKIEKVEQIPKTARGKSQLVIGLKRGNSAN